MGRILHLEQRVTPEAQACDTDSTDANLGNRGLSPALVLTKNDEALGAQMKRQTDDLAGETSPGHGTTIGVGNPVEAGSEDVTFPPLPPDNFSLAEAISNQPTDTFDGCASGLNAPGQSPARLAQSGKGLCGKRLWEMGGDLVEVFRGVSSLCSQSTAKGGRPGNLGPKCTFPLPTRRNQIALVLKAEESWVVEWVIAACLALNSLWGCQAASLQDGEPDLEPRTVSEAHTRILQSIARDVTRLGGIEEVTQDFEWTSFFRTRTIDYKGDEVRTAQQFTWKNIKPAIPREIGVVDLKDICEQGCKHYIEHFPDFLKPPHEWGQVRKAKVMVTDRDWPEVAAGLLEARRFFESMTRCC